MDFDRTRYVKWAERSTFVLSLALLMVLLWRVLSEFSFVWTDMDQSIMWLGAHEFSEGRFHQPRFFGQAYGSMLESLVAVALLWLPINVALNVATTLLFLLPYALIICLSRDRWSGAALTVFFISILPVTYLMLGTMPRDFISGIAVASLAILFLEKQQKWSFFAVAFLAVAGWSVNHSAAILSVALIGYKGLSTDIRLLNRAVIMAAGVSAALLLHAMIGMFFIAHPEFVVHHNWELDFTFHRLFQGMTQLDTHFGMIAPFAKNKGWTYLVFFIALPVVFLLQNDKRAMWSTLAFSAVALISLGINKVHDGFDSIFSSYERMFLALPVAVAFMLAKVKVPRNWIMILCSVAAAYSVYHLATLRTEKRKETDGNPRHLMSIAKANSVFERMAQIKSVAESENPEAILVGPNADWLTHFASGGSFLINDQIPIVYPHYERKTWDMRLSDQPDFTRILWVAGELHFPVDAPYRVKEIEHGGEGFRAYLITGERLHPLEIYRSLGFQVSEH